MIFFAFRLFVMGRCFWSVRGMDRKCSFLTEIHFFLVSWKAVSWKGEERCSLTLRRRRTEERFLHVQPKFKVFSLENSIMAIQEGFSLLTPFSVSSGDEFIASPRMQLQALYWTNHQTHLCNILWKALSIQWGKKDAYSHPKAPFYPPAAFVFLLKSWHLTHNTEALLMVVSASSIAHQRYGGHRDIGSGAARDLRKSLMQPPTQSKVKCEVRCGWGLHNLSG